MEDKEILQKISENTQTMALLAQKFTIHAERSERDLKHHIADDDHFKGKMETLFTNLDANITALTNALGKLSGSSIDWKWFIGTILTIVGLFAGVMGAFQLGITRKVADIETKVDSVSQQVDDISEVFNSFEFEIEN